MDQIWSKKITLMNYNYVGNIDVSAIKNKLLEVGDDIWLKHTLRQTQFAAHRETQTVELMWDINSLPNNTKGKIHSSYYDFNIESILNDLKQSYTEKYGEWEEHTFEVYMPKFKDKVEKLNETERGNTGFGSSGKY
jgi:hypothetical protein